jgi:hypothetical protein
VVCSNNLEDQFCPVGISLLPLFLRRMQVISQEKWVVCLNQTLVLMVQISFSWYFVKSCFTDHFCEFGDRDLVF